MATKCKQSHESGVVFLVLLALIVVAIAISAFFFVARAQSTDSALQNAAKVLKH